MYLGIDLGTSAVKAVLLDDRGALAGHSSAPLAVSRPQPGWSEQDPDAWVAAAEAVVAGLDPALRSAVAGIGLSGQMHGATLLGADDRPLRPCILWNDGRSAADCAALETSEPRLAAISGNRAMAGFTAPKLLWVRRHEPEVFAATRRVLLPKDYLRLVMTGEAVSEPSDASGTLWLDVAARAWSEPLLEACGLGLAAMPRLVEGSEVSGRLRPEIAARWGLPSGVPVAGGGGDNAAGAVGLGVVVPGDAFVSLGTSGVVFAVSDGFRPHPERGLHAFCHALPDRWHQMAVILSAAACVSWACGALGFSDEAAFDAAAAGVEPDAATPLFLPYLSGERTPHNDPGVRGGFVGLSHDSDRSRLAYAVLEGVAFALAEGLEVMRAAGTDPDRLSVIGGGARSAAWRPILAAALGCTLDYHGDGEVGPAAGAARLALMAATGTEASTAAPKPPTIHQETPDPAWVEALAPRRRRFAALYPALREAAGTEVFSKGLEGQQA